MSGAVAVGSLGGVEWGNRHLLAELFEHGGRGGEEVPVPREEVAGDGGAGSQATKNFSGSSAPWKLPATSLIFTPTCHE